MEKEFEIIDEKCVITSGRKEIGRGEFMDYIELVGIESLVVELPDTIERIGDHAFYDVQNLTSINLPEGLVSIGENAFDGCENLKSIHIPASVRHIGREAFSNCCELGSIEIAEGNPVYRSESNCCLTKDGKTLVFGCRLSVIPTP